MNILETSVALVVATMVLAVPDLSASDKVATSTPTKSKKSAKTKAVLHSYNHNAKCPSNYYRDGDYCMPTKSAKKGIAKSGKCPSGYFADGDFCMKTK